MGSTSGSDSGKLKSTSWRKKKKKNNNNNGRNNEKVKWEYPYGYSWPSRQYTCSFCKREFKSAQALGGHMNVHRRDRAAMLKDHSPSLPPPSTFPPWLHAYGITPTPPSNPNPSFLYSPRNPSGLTPLSSSSSSSPSVNASIYTHQYSLVSLSLSSCHFSSTLHSHSSMASTSTYGMKVGPPSSNFKEDVPVKLELGLGMICRDTKDDDDDDDHGLDLELRLGDKKP